MMSRCFIDLCEAINIFIGGLVVSALFAYLNNLIRNRKFKKRYGFLAGTYTGHGVNGEKISDAVVRYIGENKLEMTLTHPTPDARVTRKWHGFVTMFNEAYGELQFMYIEPIEDAHENGRKVIVTNNEKATWVSVGQRPVYLDEYFKRKN